MTFKTRPHRYTLDLAPTGRAQCRTCKRKIERGEARLVIDMFVRPGRGTRRAVHAQCVSSKMAMDIQRVLGGSVDRLPATGSMDTDEAARWRAGIAAVAAREVASESGDGGRREGTQPRRAEEPPQKGALLLRQYGHQTRSG